MTYAIRVRLYRGDVLEADTDPDAAEDAAGAELVEDLAAAQSAVVELCRAFHAAPGVQLLGFAPIATGARLAWLQDQRRLGQPLDYFHPYTVLLATPEGRSATDWRARVDIALSP
jgi:hypothetical protein